MDTRVLPVVEDRASRLEFIAEAIGEQPKTLILGEIPHVVPNRADRRRARRSR